MVDAIETERGVMDKGYFNSRFQFDKHRTTVWRAIANYLQEEIRHDSIILDMGAGYCEFINSIRAKEKHALDTFNDLEKFADDDVNIHLQSCSNLKNFDSDYFDVVFASNLFEHLTMENFKKTLDEAHRILRRGGKLMVIQPNFKYSYREYFDDYTHTLVFTEAGMCDALSGVGFNIITCIPRFLPFSMKSKLPKFRPLIDLYLRLPIKPFAKQMLIIAEKR